MGRFVRLGAGVPTTAEPGSLTPYFDWPLPQEPESETILDPAPQYEVVTVTAAEPEPAAASSPTAVFEQQTVAAGETLVQFEPGAAAPPEEEPRPRRLTELPLPSPTPAREPAGRQAPSDGLLWLGLVVLGLGFLGGEK